MPSSTRAASDRPLDDRAEAAAKRDARRLISAGNPATLRLWKTRDGWLCHARTRSEARAIWKRTCGRAVPAGMVFEEVKEIAK